MRQTEVTRAVVGSVCSFPTFMQVILWPWLLCVLKVMFKGLVCSQVAKNKCWVPGSLGQAGLLLKIKVASKTQNRHLYYPEMVEHGATRS